MSIARIEDVAALAAAFGADAKALETAVGQIAPNVRKLTTDADRAPLPSDDETQGYAVGSQWMHGGQQWVAHRVSEGAATWVPQTPLIGPPSALFGIKGDGSLDDIGPMAAWIAAGGGMLGPGTYMVDPIYIAAGQSLRLIGTDRDRVIIRLRPEANLHLLELASGSANVIVDGVTLDQNGATQTGGHGVRLGGTHNLSMRNFRITNCHSYGIGAQGGANTAVTIDNFEISECGQDGIDIKDYDLANEAITITNGLIHHYGKSGGGKVGLDIRGPVNASNITLDPVYGDTNGLRHRIASVQGRAGSGNISNILVKMATGGLFGYTAEGASVTSVNVSNLHVRDGRLAVIRSDGGVYSGLSGSGPTEQESLRIEGPNNDIRGLNITGASRGVDFDPGAENNRVSGFNIRGLVGGTEAIRVQAGLVGNTISDGAIDSGATINDQGTDTTIKGVRGWKTAANLVSADLDVATTGTRTVTFTHGLAVTPQPQDISLAVIRSTGNPSDHRIGLLQVDSITSTTVVVRMIVTTASATAGAAVKVAATIRAKNS